VVFGSRDAADIARKDNAPFQVFSVAEAAECRGEAEEERELCGPLLIICTTVEQAKECRIIAQDRWTGGKLLMVVNADWLSPTAGGAVGDFACSLDPIYFVSVAAFEVCSAYCLCSL
jgi:hypothetical protein